MPERTHSHTFVSSHKAGFLRGNLPIKPVESPAAYTQKGGDYMIEASKASVQCDNPGHWHCLWLEGQASVSSQEAAVTECMRWNGSLAGLSA